jgi:hypothetical protein
MPWIFHTDFGTGKVLSRKGALARADFSGEARTVSEGFREVTDDSSWVLANRDPDRLLQLLREDPEWVVRELLEDTCGKVAIGDVENHLSLIGLPADVVAEWRDRVSTAPDTSDAPRSPNSEDGQVFTPTKENPKVLRAQLIEALAGLADSHSTDAERLLSTRRLENLAARTSVASADAAIARILGCRGFVDATPLTRIKLAGIEKKFFGDLIACCDSAEDRATLVLIGETTREAKLAAAAVTDEDKALLEEFLVGLLKDAANSLSLQKRSEGEPTNQEIRRLFSRIILMTGNAPASLVAAMLEVRVAAAGADAKSLTKAIDGFVNQIGPTVDTLKSVARLTSDLPPHVRTACLNSLPFESGSARVLYLEALLDVVGPTLLDGQEPWQKVTTRELASGWADDHPVITAMVESDCGRKAATSAIRKDLDRMDASRLGLLLDLHPDVRALITDEMFVKALVRLMERNANVAKLPELIAQPLINEALEEIQQQKSVLEDQQRELEAEFREQVSERDNQITDLERELEQARSQIASRTNEVRGARDAELRQATIETLKGCAQMVTNLQEEEGNEVILEKLEQALKEAGLVILDRPGETVTFDSGRHERLGRGSGPKVKVVLSAIGYAEGESVSIIIKGLVRNVE